MAAGHFGKRGTEMAWMGPRNIQSTCMSWRPLSGGILGSRGNTLGKNVRASEGQRVVFTLLYLPTSSKFHVYVEAQYIRHMKMKFFMDIGAGPHLDAILPAARPPPTSTVGSTMGACWEFPEMVCRASGESMWRYCSSRSCPGVRQRAGVSWGWRWGRPVRMLLVGASA